MNLSDSEFALYVRELLQLPVRQRGPLSERQLRKAKIPPERPTWHRPTRTWSSLSPSENPYIVWWSDAPRIARLRWLLMHPRRWR